MAPKRTAGLRSPTAGGGGADVSQTMQNAVSFAAAGFIGLVNVVGLTNGEVANVLRNERAYPSVVYGIALVAFAVAAISVFARRSWPVSGAVALYLVIGALAVSLVAWLPVRTYSDTPYRIIAGVVGGLLLLAALAVASRADWWSGRDGLGRRLLPVVLTVVAVGGLAITYLPGPNFRTVGYRVGATVVAGLFLVVAAVSALRSDPAGRTDPPRWSGMRARLSARWAGGPERHRSAWTAGLLAVAAFAVLAWPLFGSDDLGPVLPVVALLLVVAAGAVRLRATRTARTGERVRAAGRPSRLPLQAVLTIASLLLVATAGYGALRLEARAQARPSYPAIEVRQKAEEVTVTVSATRVSVDDRIGVKVLVLPQSLDPAAVCLATDGGRPPVRVPDAVDSGTDASPLPCSSAPCAYTTACTPLLTGVVRADSAGAATQTYVVTVPPARYRGLFVRAELCARPVEGERCPTNVDPRKVSYSSTTILG